MGPRVRFRSYLIAERLAAVHVPTRHPQDPADRAQIRKKRTASSKAAKRSAKSSSLSRSCTTDVHFRKQTKSNKRATVLGAGTMGHGIAQVLAMAWHRYHAVV